MDRLLTGRELKIAAEKKLRVRYVEFLRHVCEPIFDGVIVLEKTQYGYLFGDISINLENWQDDRLACGILPNGFFCVYTVFGIDYR